MYSSLYLSIPMNKKDLAALIDAYADAKSTRNQILIQQMVTQLERALDQVFGPEVEEEESQQF